MARIGRETKNKVWHWAPDEGDPLPADRAIAVFPRWGDAAENLNGVTDKVKSARGGWVLARTALDQSWEPRLVKVPHW